MKIHIFYRIMGYELKKIIYIYIKYLQILSNDGRARLNHRSIKPIFHK